MADELFYRTEDLRLDEVLGFYVETGVDRSIVETLKSRSPVLLKGSRGVGKSFLLRVAEAEMRADFARNKVLPVYLTFARAGLLRQSKDGFSPWMIAKILASLKRASVQYGLEVSATAALTQLLNTTGSYNGELELVENRFEKFWESSPSALPGESIEIESVREFFEVFCEATGVHRVTLLVDEAAHVFVPEQQRQFFTIMRDLRSPFVSVKAAVYPGATSFGESFQPTHDATVLEVERNVGDPGYRAAMREIVLKQQPSWSKDVDRNSELFDTLAYASSGNPRILLKTLASSRPLRRNSVQDVMRSYYREEIWAEHSNLAERYPGHRPLIDWGRNFMESEVLPAIHSRNQGDRSTSSAIWIHRDAPQVVVESLRLLCYSGILQEGDSGIRATRSEVGGRYFVNLGCNMAQDRDPVRYGLQLRQSLSVKRMQEFGANHSAFRPIKDFAVDKLDRDGNAALEARLGAPIRLLDITQFQRAKLTELRLNTIGDVLTSTEEEFQKAKYVGRIRSRQMRNAAISAVIEFLSG